MRLPGTVGTVLTPAVATLFGAGAFDRIRSGFARALRLAIMATLPLLALTEIALGPEALTVAGARIRGGARPLIVMACASIVVPMSILSVAVLIGLGRLRGQLVIDFAAAAVNIALAFALIPDHGALGAAIANSGAQLVSGVAALVYRRGSWAGCRGAVLAPARRSCRPRRASERGRCSQRSAGSPGSCSGRSPASWCSPGWARSSAILPADDAEWLAGDASSRLGGLVGVLAARFGRSA